MTYQSALDIIMRNGKVSETDADRVFQYYRMHRLFKYNAHDGYTIIHGGFFDHEPIRRALRRYRQCAP